MERRVWKYDLPLDDVVEITMCVGAKILTVQLQGETMCLWALVDPYEATEIRTFRVAGTGHPIEYETDRLNYIDSVQMLDGILIWHVFEIVGSEVRAEADSD